MDKGVFSICLYLPSVRLLCCLFLSNVLWSDVVRFELIVALLCQLLSCGQFVVHFGKWI